MSITFNGIALRNMVDGLKVTGVQVPTLPPKDRNLVDVPGKDYPYDFGNNYKNSFEVIISIAIVAIYDAENIEGEATIEEKINILSTKLDFPEAQNLAVAGNTYKAQIYDGIYMEIKKTRTLAVGEIVFECKVPEAV